MIGVHSACSAACPNGACPPATYTCTSGNLPNNYSLQLNTNPFITGASLSCNKHPEWQCQGWQQFVFSNRYCEGNAGQGEACAYIEYWLFNYNNGKSCPWGWQLVPGGPGRSGGCVINSHNAVAVKEGCGPGIKGGPFNVDDLGFMKLSGVVAGVGWPEDWVTFTCATNVYSAPGDNRSEEPDWRSTPYG